MDRGVVKHALLAWLLLVVCGVLNGVFREAVLTPRVGSDFAPILSTAILCAVILVVSWLFVRWQGLTETRVLLAVGALWLALTMVFEFGFGHYVMGHPWERLLANYNIFRGRIWVLVLLGELVGPRAMAWLSASRWREPPRRPRQRRVRADWMKATPKAPGPRYEPSVAPH